MICSIIAVAMLIALAIGIPKMLISLGNDEPHGRHPG